MSSETVLYFEVEGMVCGACTDTVETSIRNMAQEEKDVENTLNQKKFGSGSKFIEEVSVNLLTKRVRVVSQEDIDPQAIVKLLKEFGYEARYIEPMTEKKLYFSLSGLSSSLEARKLEEMLKKKAYTKSCEVNFSTHSVTIISCVSNDAEMEDTIARQVKTDMESFEGINVKATRIRPPIDEDATTQDPRLFYYNAMINGIAGLILIAINGLLPPPVSLAGKLIGLLIGSATLAVMIKTGKEFYVRAWGEMKRKQPSTMDTLVALGTGSAWMYSMLVVLGLLPAMAMDSQFLAVNMILGIINLGNGLKTKAQEDTKRKVRSFSQVFLNLQPQIARRFKNKFHDSLLNKENAAELAQSIEQISYLDIKEGDVLLVGDDERIPVEGIIISKNPTYVNKETLTGESVQAPKKKGESVPSGGLTRDMIVIRASRNGPEGNLTKMKAHIEKAKESKPSTSNLVNRIASYFVPTILSIAALTALGWFIFGPAPVLPWVIEKVTSVLLCACPCAFGLSFPISTALWMYQSLRKGILIKHADALESVVKADTYVFDKTGTLTETLVDTIFVGHNQGSQEDNEARAKNIIQYVASLEHEFIQQKKCAHPIARAFVDKNYQSELLPCTKVDKEGQGISGIVENTSILVGSHKLLTSRGVKIHPDFVALAKQNKGKTSVYIAFNNECVALASLSHVITEEAFYTIKELKKRKVDIFMLTGDTEGPAKSVAQQLGISKVYYDHEIDHKEAFIKNLKKQGRYVILVGDGWNDVPGMAAADLSIAVGSSVDASSEAKITVEKLDYLPLLNDMAKQTMSNIHQNLCWTAFYNAISLTIATGVIYFIIGVSLNPVVASVGMAISSLFVVANSSRLKGDLDYLIRLHEGKEEPPRTWFQKIIHILSLRSFYQMIEIFLLSHDEDIKPTKMKSAPPSPKKPPSPQKSPFPPNALVMDLTMDQPITIKQEPGVEVQHVPKEKETSRRETLRQTARGRKRRGY